MRFTRYEYPTDKNEVGSYTIKEGVKPLGFKGEKKVQSFEYNGYENRPYWLNK